MLFVDRKRGAIPVCLESIDQVVGVLYAEDYLVIRDRIQSPADLQPYLHKPFFCPENIFARQLIQQLESERISLALVVNEYGTVVGLVTRTDLRDALLDKLAGQTTSVELYTKASEHSIIAQGKLPINELEELLGVDLEPVEGVVTVGGWLIHKMGTIPTAGASFQSGNLRFQVLAADPNRVKKVFIQRMTG
jgi:Hemolysins and related proteins containing CBS domains